ncbi:hypothetical protein Deipe_2497 [Deinococcus peraridilitoris DSM 19664]|uniref:Uncharacterized protein n=1 Tax=Deinococcus peraridilitoris (strain DSM 19664 / LMG 22246 / CIP 109416 / KR-200) TaxID=937777 RepID=L0A4L0_DEIPD|nr:hypothetical protein Deipe_2497 [Deinococcus peraridilitoris DSM 19664]
MHFRGIHHRQALRLAWSLGAASGAIVALLAPHAALILGAVLLLLTPYAFGFGPLSRRLWTGAAIFAVLIGLPLMWRSASDSATFLWLSGGFLLSVGVLFSTNTWRLTGASVAGRWGAGLVPVGLTLLSAAYLAPAGIRIFSAPQQVGMATLFEPDPAILPEAPQEVPAMPPATKHEADLPVIPSLPVTSTAPAARPGAKAPEVRRKQAKPSTRPATPASSPTKKPVRPTATAQRAAIPPKSASKPAPVYSTPAKVPAVPAVRASSAAVVRTPVKVPVKVAAPTRSGLSNSKPIRSVTVKPSPTQTRITKPASPVAPKAPKSASPSTATRPITAPALPAPVPTSPIRREFRNPRSVAAVGTPAPSTARPRRVTVRSPRQIDLSSSREKQATLRASARRVQEILDARRARPISPTAVCSQKCPPSSSIDHLDVIAREGSASALRTVSATPAESSWWADASPGQAAPPRTPAEPSPEPPAPETTMPAPPPMPAPAPAPTPAPSQPEPVPTLPTLPLPGLVKELPIVGSPRNDDDREKKEPKDERKKNKSNEKGRDR